MKQQKMVFMTIILMLSCLMIFYCSYSLNNLNYSIQNNNVPDSSSKKSINAVLNKENMINISNIKLLNYYERIRSGDNFSLKFQFDNHLEDNQEINITLNLKNKFVDILNLQTINDNSLLLEYIVSTRYISFLGNHSLSVTLISEDGGTLYKNTFILFLHLDESIFVNEEGFISYSNKGIFLIISLIVLFASYKYLPSLYRDTISGNFSYNNRNTRILTVIGFTPVLIFISFFVSIFIFGFLALFGQILPSSDDIFVKSFSSIIFPILIILSGLNAGYSMANSSHSKLPSRGISKKLSSIGSFEYVVVSVIISYGIITDINFYILGFRENLYFYTSVIPSITEIVFFSSSIILLYNSLNKTNQRNINGLRKYGVYALFLIYSSFLCIFYNYSGVPNIFFFSFCFVFLISYVISMIIMSTLPRLQILAHERNYLDIDETYISFTINMTKSRLLEKLGTLEVNLEAKNLSLEEEIDEKNKRKKDIYFMISQGESKKIVVPLYNLKEFNFIVIDAHIPQYFKIIFNINFKNYRYLKFYRTIIFQVSRRSKTDDILRVLNTVGFSEEDMDTYKNLYPSSSWEHSRCIGKDHKFTLFQNKNLVLYVDPFLRTTNKQINHYLDFMKEILMEIEKDRMDKVDSGFESNILSFYVYNDLSADAKGLIAELNMNENNHIFLLPEEGLNSHKFNSKELSNYINKKYRRYFHEEDPYSLERGEIKEKDEFFGRQSEIAMIINAVKTRAHLGIFGIRKIGKSSLLRMVTQNKGIIAVKLNFRNDIKEMLEESYSDLSDKLVSFDLIDHIPELQLDSKSKLQKLVVDYSRIMRRKPGILHSLGLIFDEIDTMNYDHFSDFWQFLRLLAEETDAITLIIVGNQPKINRMQTFPVYQFFNEYFLPPLDYDETKEMIVTLGVDKNLKWEDDLLKAIHSISGGHPRHSRDICSLLRKNYPEVYHYELDHLKGIFGNIESYYIAKEELVADSIFGDLGLDLGVNNERNIQMEILHLIGEEKVRKSDLIIEEIAKNFFLEISDVRVVVVGSLGHLIDMKVLIRDNKGNYHFLSKIVKFWFTRRLDIDDI